jgi:hypothetical protein
MVRDFITIAEEEAEMDYKDEKFANQDRTTSEAVEDTLSLEHISDDGVMVKLVAMRRC